MQPQTQQINNRRIYHTSTNSNIKVLLHDIFNVSILSVISILNAIYLLLVVSDVYDYITIPLFPIILYSFMIYIVLDTIIIYYFPYCVVSKPRDLLHRPERKMRQNYLKNKIIIHFFFLIVV
jgi:hypothetical protein